MNSIEDAVIIEFAVQNPLIAGIILVVGFLALQALDSLLESTG
jgi:hypothetical protein